MAPPCSGEITSVARVKGLAAWKFKVTSQFWYNYRTLRKARPRPESSTLSPLWSISDEDAWNSPWSTTVKFVDATAKATVHAVLPFLSVMSTTLHIWLQEDAWGNCTPFSNALL